MLEIRFLHLATPIKEQIVCEQTHQLYRQGRSILIRTESPQHTMYLDQLLWTFSRESFVPHAQLPCDLSVNPVLLTHEDTVIKGVEALILAGERASTQTSFDYMQQFSIIIDFAEVYDDQKRQRSRERFRRWRELGCSPTFEKM